MQELNVCTVALICKLSGSFNISDVFGFLFGFPGCLCDVRSTGAGIKCLYYTVHYLWSGVEESLLFACLDTAAWGVVLVLEGTIGKITSGAIPPATLVHLTDH